MRNGPRGLAAAVACAAVLGAAPLPAPAAPAASPGVRVTLTTANVQNVLTRAQARADIRRATASSSVVLLQEMWRRRVTRLVPPGWGVWHPAQPVRGCRDNAVIWDRRVWSLGPHHGVRLHWADLVGNCAAVAVLVHRGTGLRLPVIGVHLLPHVEVAGHPRKLPRLVPFHRSLDRVFTQANTTWEHYGQVIVGGDWNVDWVADWRVRSGVFPWRHFHQVFDSNWGQLPWTAPTHAGGRRIDTWWWSDRPGLRIVNAATLGRTWSDHNFVQATFRVPLVR